MLDINALARPVGLLVLSLLITRIATVRVDTIGASGSALLYDSVHRALPDLRRFESMIDLFPISALLVCAFAVPQTQWPTFVTALAVLFTLRAMCISLTILPSPICRPTQPRVSALGGCHDCVFSGHTATVILAWLFVVNSNPSLKMFACIHSLLTIVVVLGTRSHWSIDVIVAVLAAKLVYDNADAFGGSLSHE